MCRGIKIQKTKKSHPVDNDEIPDVELRKSMAELGHRYYGFISEPKWIEYDHNEIIFKERNNE